MKENDWVVATLNNPSFDAGDFQYVLDMNLDNTLLLPKSSYLRSPYITENDRFKDSSGQFSESLFNDFYNKAVDSFKEFSTEDIVNNYEYDMYDVMRPKNGKVKNPGFNMGVLPNPDHVRIGVEGFNLVTASGKSRRELAQNSKIYDTATGTYLDKSVNDISLFSNPIEYFKSLASDPLVYATYDEDTEEIDPTTGAKVVHKKGEWKVNPNGEYYTETLNGRSLIGKQVVSAGDYLTPEDSAFNKYDFFDSDDLLKSVGGSIAKSLAVIAPMLIPYVGTAYSGILIAKELLKTAPMLYGIATTLTDKEKSESKLTNVLAAYGEKFSLSQSDYASNNTFSFENFANLMADVVTQWGQQKLITLSYSKLIGGNKRIMETATHKALKAYYDEVKKKIDDLLEGKADLNKVVAMTGTASPTREEMAKMFATGKWLETPIGKAAKAKFITPAEKLIEKRNKMGGTLSLAYMSLISNTDVYSTILEKGGTPEEAAILALGSTVGMFAVDKYTGLGEIFIDKVFARNAIRESAIEAALSIMVSGKAASTATKKGVLGLFLKGITSGKEAVSTYFSKVKDGTLGFVGKALGEGLEEVSEELVTDFTKSAGEVLGRMGYFSQTDYGAWDNAFDRYVMSFLGGMAGGGLFYGIDAFKGNNQTSQEVLTELTYHLMNGKKNEILKEYKRLYDSGKLGSKTLSDKLVNGVYLTAEKEEDSQAYKVYDTLVKTTNQLDFILNENNLKLNEDDLFDKMVQGEYRALALSDFLRGDARDKSKKFSYITKWQEDFNNLAKDIQNVLAKIDGMSDNELKSAEGKLKMDSLLKEKEELLKKRDDLFREGSLEYVRKMLFAMDTDLSGQFVNITFNQFVRSETGKNIWDLSSEQLDALHTKFEQSLKGIKSDLDTAYKLYKDMSDRINPSIDELTKFNWEKFAEELKTIALTDPYISFNWDFKMDDEDEDDYNHRYAPKKGETEELFKQRRLDRLKKLTEYANKHQAEWVQKLAETPIDLATFRKVNAKLAVLLKNILDRIIAENFTLVGVSTKLQHDLLEIIKRVGVENPTQLQKEMRDAIKASFRENVINTLKQYYASKSQDDIFDEGRWSAFTKAVMDLYAPEGFNIESGTFLAYMLKENPNITENDISRFIAYLDTEEAEEYDPSKLLAYMLKENPNITEEDVSKLLEYYQSEKEKWLGEVTEMLPAYMDADNPFIITKGDVFKFLDDYRAANEKNPERLTSVEDGEESQESDYEFYKRLARLHLGDIFGTKDAPNTLLDNLASDYARNKVTNEAYAAISSAEDTDESEEVDPITQAKAMADAEEGEIVFGALYNFDAYINNLVENPTNQILDIIDQQVVPAFEKDEDYQTLKKLSTAKFIDNPVMPILKAIVKKLRNDESIDIESYLKDVFELYLNSEHGGTFVLTDDQITDLDNFLRDLTIAKAFVHAASVRTSSNTPIGHNKAINLFANNHSDIYKKWENLPELEESIGAAIIHELDNYMREIQEWKALSMRNRASTVNAQVNFDLNFIKARFDFFVLNRELFKIRPDIDLLDGYEEMEPSFVNLAKLELLMHNGFLKAIEKGLTVEEIFDAILPKLTKVSDIVEGKVAKLTENIVYKDFTEYDKFAYLITNFVVDNGKFWAKMRKFIEDNDSVAPLTSQEYAARLNYAQETNPDIINKALAYVEAHLGNKTNLSFLPNTSVITGVGGSGKTSVVAGLTIENGKDCWHSGPTQDLITKLSLSLKESTPKTIDELLEMAIGSEMAKNLDDYKATASPYIVVKGYDNNSTVRLKDGITINKIDNAPKSLIIDEATHLSTAKLLVLAKFCEANGINLKLIGDSHLNGFFKPDVMLNFSREFVLAWRTPPLYISLRGDSVQKYLNLIPLLKMLDEILDSNLNNTAEYVKQVLQGYLKSYKLKYFNGDEFKGDMMVDSLTDDIVGKLTSSEAAKIGFVGDVTSPSYKKLVEAGHHVQAMQSTNIQGQEFDYVVVDKEWDYYLNENNPGGSIESTILFLLDLYTMSTRSIKGTIFLDRGLSKYIRLAESFDSSKIDTILKAADKFREIRLKQLEELATALTLDDTTPTEIKTKEKSPFDPKDIKKEMDEEKNKGKDTSGQDAEETKAEELSKDGEKFPENSVVWSEDFPLRLYCNVHLGGINTSEKVWRKDGSTTDLGIFMEDDDIIGDKLKKQELVRKLLKFKCLFTYGHINKKGKEWRDFWKNKVPNYISDKFSQDSLKNVKYYIVAQEATDNNRLIGLTDLDNEKRAIKLKEGKDIIVTVVAKIQGIDGKTYTVTIGALPNPETWGSKENRDKIKKRIEKLINSGDPNKDKLQSYLNNLDSIVEQYDQWLNGFVDKGAEIEIEAPEFDGMSSLIPRKHLRLATLESDEFNPWSMANTYLVTSPTYVFTEIPEGIPEWVKGKPVMFSSGDLFVSGSELMDMYLEQKKAQKEGKPHKGEVRLIKVDDAGVSFSSLYRDKYRHIYTIKYGDELRVAPYKAYITGVRMYLAAWNFRANLRTFVALYQDLIDHVSKSEGITEELVKKEIESWCKLDREKYVEIREKKSLEVEESKRKDYYLSEEDYRNEVKNSTEISEEDKEKLQTLWKFNDDIGPLCRLFRLGYEGKHGAYIRKLTNTGDLYGGETNVLGVYINGSTAEDYLKAIEALFTNVLDKVIPVDVNKANPDQYIPLNKADDLKGFFKEEDWVELAKVGKDLHVTLVDAAGIKTDGSFNFVNQETMSLLPQIFINTARFTGIRAYNKYDFDHRLEPDPATGEFPTDRYSIKYGDIPLKWETVGEAFKLQETVYVKSEEDKNKVFPGFELDSYTDSEGNTKWDIIDRRLDNLFCLMFHGCVALKYDNNFLSKEPRATDAYFKYGFFSDTVIAKQEEGRNKILVPVITNRWLLTANAVTGLPIAHIKVKQKSAPTGKPAEEKTEESKGAEPVFNYSSLLDAESSKIIENAKVDKRGLRNAKNAEDLVMKVQDKINKRLKTMFNTFAVDTKFSDIIVGVSLDNGKLKFTYLKDIDPIFANGYVENFSFDLGQLVLNKDDNTVLCTIQYRPEADEPFNITSLNTNLIEIQSDTLDDSEDSLNGTKSEEPVFFENGFRKQEYLGDVIHNFNLAFDIFLAELTNTAVNSKEAEAMNEVIDSIKETVKGIQKEMDTWGDLKGSMPSQDKCEEIKGKISAPVMDAFGYLTSELNENAITAFVNAYTNLITNIDDNIINNCLS